MESMNGASGAPTKEAHWLLSLMDALKQNDSRYAADPQGIVTLGRAVAKFSWDADNQRFYAKVIDSRPGTGNVAYDIITGIDPETQTVNEAAAKIHGQILLFLKRLR